MSTLQQVNLFLPEFRPERGTFRFTTMLWAWGAIALFLGLVQLWGWTETEHARTRLVELENEDVRVLQQLQSLRSSTPQSTRTRIEENIRTARETLARRNQLLNAMRAQTKGNADGFSEFLVGLARQHIEGLSLDGFQFINGGDQVELSGWTYKPELIPEYMRRLRGEQSFSETRFGEMSIERNMADRSDALRFSLGAPREGGS